jgi:hypothetical protein
MVSRRQSRASRPTIGDENAQQRWKPIAAALAAWADETVRKLSRKSELAAAFRYMRARRLAPGRCFDDGRPALDNNPAECALRCVAVGRKNYLFVGGSGLRPARGQAPPSACMTPVNSFKWARGCSPLRSVE